LDDTIRTLTSAPDTATIKPKNIVSGRRTIVRAWAQVLRAIERSYDPTFNPNDPRNMPEECLIPPREPDGTQEPSCADPNDVRDPKARAAYTEAIRANDLKIERWNNYWSLKDRDDAAMTSLQMQLKLFREESAPPDFAALDRILRQAGLSDARRKEIDAMF
ncbi:MAG TPA: hypothetical protein VMH02_05770, partial [Verrucomicrobiae bacterium]|nr:hypothetical protein [Verrucomicrobiae bacterium]